MKDCLDIVLLSAYHGGSHAAFADCFSKHSRHRVRVVTLPARKWKWRMRGAAIWLARDGCDWLNTPDGGAIDAILCDDMLSVADLKALLPASRRNTPIACYFHENQLSYPIPNEADRDYQYGMTNISSCLAADAVWFNSTFHRDDFLDAAASLLKKMPDFVPQKICSEILAKSAVMSPPVDLPPLRQVRDRQSEPVTFLWCHRWEYDKNPEPFFRALLRLAADDVSFRLVMLGEQFRTAPAVFADSWSQLEPHILHAGFLESRADYLAMLQRCDIVVSTAIQENFGIAVAEAIGAGCQPLLPDRLAYPGLIPPELSEACLFADDSGLYDRMLRLTAGDGLLDEEERQRLRGWVSDLCGVRKAAGRIDCGLTELEQSQSKCSVRPPWRT